MHQDEPNITEWLKVVLGNEADLSVLNGSEERIRKAYRQYLSGYSERSEGLAKIVVDDFRGAGEVSQKGIPFFSFCGHHFLPFFGTVDISYEPGSKLIGIGKLPRIVSHFCRRFTLQEQMVTDIGEFLVSYVDPKSVRVSSSARHLCVEARGPAAYGSTTSADFNWRAT